MWLEPWILEAQTWLFWSSVALTAAAALYGLLRFVHATHLARVLSDLPVANIRSASQGYVRLQGRARMLAGEPVIAPLSGKPCVWYRFAVEQRERDPELDSLIGGWQSIESGCSDAIFALEDHTGRCVVDPDGAEVMPSTTIAWRGREPRPGFSPESTRRWNLFFGTGPYRYTESRIHDHESLSGIGDFETLGCGPVSSPDEEVRRVLSAWKRDRANLLRRFDENRDGAVDFDEWEQAQRAAEREVATGMHEPVDTGPVHLLRQPRDGRAFCLFAGEAKVMVMRRRADALSGGALFLGLVMVLFWALYIRLAF